MNAERCPTEEELLAMVAGDVRVETSHIVNCAHCQRLLEKLHSESTIFRTSSVNSKRSTMVPTVANYPAKIDKFVVVGMWDDNPLFVTYRGLHSVVRREVIIQVAHEALCDQPNFLEIFRANCTQWMRPRANVARLLDAGEYQSRPYLVGEFVDGLRLDRLSNETHMDVAALMRVFLHLTETLIANPGIPHPNMSVSSIVIDSNNQSVLLDWAAAVEFGRTLENSSNGTEMTARRLAKTFCDAVFALDRSSPSDPICYDKATLCDDLIARGVIPAIAKSLALIAIEESVDFTFPSDLRDIFRPTQPKTIWRRLFNR